MVVRVCCVGREMNEEREERKRPEKNLLDKIEKDIKITDVCLNDVEYCVK